MAKYEKSSNPKWFTTTSGPLSPEMYRLTMHDFKIPSSLNMFKESEDPKDVESYIHGFREWLSLLGANDGIIYRIFSACLAGEA
jgi:hypothetical protein